MRRMRTIRGMMGIAGPLLGGLGTALAVGTAAPAGAAPPVRFTRHFETTVEDLEGDECGFPIRWEIRGTSRVQQFLDNSGKLVRIQAHIRETNVVTNLETGHSLRDEPVFNQIVNIGEDGTLPPESVETVGLFVNVRGETGRNVMDVGKVILRIVSPTERELIFEAGQHPFRMETLLDLEEGLSAFCEVLR
jgi:hypothetical protein